MSAKTAFVCCTAAALFIGCNNANHSKHEMASKEDSKVCDIPGQGKAVANAGGLGSVRAAQPAMAVFGGEQKLSAADAVPVAKVLENPDPYKNKYVRLTGKVSSVCAKKGCWLRVVPDKTTAAANPATTQPLTDIFIKFRDPPEGRLIPMEAVGHNVTVEGTLQMAMMREAAARHFKEDGGATPEEVEKIKGPQPQLMIAGPVVAIEGVQKPTE